MSNVSQPLQSMPVSPPPLQCQSCNASQPTPFAMSVSPPFAMPISPPPFYNQPTPFAEQCQSTHLLSNQHPPFPNSLPPLHAHTLGCVCGDVGHGSVESARLGLWKDGEVLQGSVLRGRFTHVAPLVAFHAPTRAPCTARAYGVPFTTETTETRMGSRARPGANPCSAPAYAITARISCLCWACTSWTLERKNLLPTGA